MRMYNLKRTKKSKNQKLNLTLLIVVLGDTDDTAMYRDTKMLNA